MANPHQLSSPNKRGFPQTDTRFAFQSTQDIGRSRVGQEVGNEEFCRTYLSTSTDKSWNAEERRHVAKIKDVGDGEEISLYTGNAPLLCLLNSMSQRVATDGQGVLVFRAGNKCKVKNPFTGQHLLPDIIVQWEPPGAFEEIDYSNDEPSTKTWTELAAVGEVKVSKSPANQAIGYLQSHLQFHPELTATLGFSILRSGYVLFYHDAAVVHQSTFDWKKSEPLFGFIEKLYTRPFRDPSMQIESAQAPTWATRISTNVYKSNPPNTLGRPDIQGGPGQRRYTALAVDAVGQRVFIKDIWRDKLRFFFEGLLLKRAHEDKHLCGLLSPDCHGYVLDESGKPIRTTLLVPKPITGGDKGKGNKTKTKTKAKGKKAKGKAKGDKDDKDDKDDTNDTNEAPGRFKMRMITKEVGQPLEGVHSLFKFLCAMYDACAVQRNLYRKCKIMHRDISDKNIMFAADPKPIYVDADSYSEVKFVNQVLAKDKTLNPSPACLVIDLGNGADLNSQRGTAKLTERTGTPKFIARSVSSGGLLSKFSFPSTSAEIPPIERELAGYHQFMHAGQYPVPNQRVSTTPPAGFTHRLFHDAESTFWVMAWTLTRSIKEGSEQEEEPHDKFGQFFYTMAKHYPIPRVTDSRHVLIYTTEEDWQSILHPDLAILAPMLANMFKYIHPEWAYRPELDDEHVHEALMRLLLIEILKINGDNDIKIHIGGRNPPPAPPGEDSLPLSYLHSLTSNLATPSQTTRSTGPPTNSTGGSSKRRHESFSGASISNKYMRIDMPDVPSSRTRFQLSKSNAPALPQAEDRGQEAAQEGGQETGQETGLVWLAEPSALQEPRFHGEFGLPSSPSPEQTNPPAEIVEESRAGGSHDDTGDIYDDD